MKSALIHMRGESGTKEKLESAIAIKPMTVLVSCWSVHFSRFVTELKFHYLRSTKWNASLILACDSAELVSLCKVMLWKTHIPVRQLRSQGLSSYRPLGRVRRKKNVSDFAETFCVRNKCFPVCAAQETSWATMCPQECVLVYQGLFLCKSHHSLSSLPRTRLLTCVVLSRL